MNTSSALLGKVGGALLVLCCWTTVAAAQDDRAAKPAPHEQELYFRVEQLNAGVPRWEPSAALHTPRSVLEHFVLSARQGQFARAAWALNLNRVPESDRPRLAADLAERFYYVLAQKLRFNFSDIPDRPDGEADVAADSPQAGAARPRRSIKIGSIRLELWDVEIRIERFKAPDQDPVWLFSPRTVEHIDNLYRLHGPGPLVYYLPRSARLRLLSQDPVWYWGTLSVLAVFSGIAGSLAQRVLLTGLQRLPWRRSSSLIDAARGPLALIAAGLIFSYLTFSKLSLSGPSISTLATLTSILIVVGLTWFAIRLIHALSTLFCDVYLDRLAYEEEPFARSHVTRMSVIRHVMIFAAVASGLGVILRELNIFETLPLSLLASAGAVSVLLGVAAHSILGNFMAGLQIGLTQPARIGDSVSFEGNFGVVEEIGYTYITIRTWDARRVIIPFSYFIAHPVENWSIKSARIVRPIYLHVDYRTDVMAVRRKFEELLEASPDWDRMVPPTLEVTDLKERTMELRALCSAKDPPTAWRLHCRIREELMAFIQGEGRFLPTYRLAFEPRGDAAVVSAGNGESGRETGQVLRPVPSSGEASVSPGMESRPAEPRVPPGAPQDEMGPVPPPPRG